MSAPHEHFLSCGNLGVRLLMIPQYCFRFFAHLSQYLWLLFLGMNSFIPQFAQTTGAIFFAALRDSRLALLFFPR